MCVYVCSPQALLREKQKADELEKVKEAIKQLIQDAAVRTRKEVWNFLPASLYCWHSFLIVLTTSCNC